MENRHHIATSFGSLFHNIIRQAILTLPLLFILIFLILASTAFALPFPTKTENNLMVGLTPVQTTISGGYATSCFWAKLPVNRTSLPALSKSDFEFTKTTSISNINIRLIKGTYTKYDTTFLHSDCEPVKNITEMNKMEGTKTILKEEDVKAKENKTCFEYNTTKTTGEWSYPTVSNSNEVEYCFRYNTTRNKDGKIELGNSNPFNITLLGLKADPDPACGPVIINASDTYTMTANCNVNGSTAYTLNATGIVFDCAGFVITGNNTANTIGIYSYKANTTIKNCQIRNFSTGIIFLGNNTTATNNTISLASIGMADNLLPVTSGLSLWVDASDASSFNISGTGITQWNDKSGNSNHLTQSTAANRPTRTTDAGTGMPVVRHVAANSEHLTVNVNFPAPVTIITVQKLAGTTNSRLLSGRNNNWLHGFHGGTVNDAYYNGWVLDSATAATTNWYIHTGLITGVGTNTLFYSNLTLIANNTGGVAGPNGLCTSGLSCSSEFSDGDVAEILIYNRVLTDAEWRSLESYLAAKWFSGSASSSITLGSIINNTINTTGTGISLSSSGITVLQNNITSVAWINDATGLNYYNSSVIGNIYYLSDGTASWDAYDIITNDTGSPWATGGTARPFSKTTVPSEWASLGNDSHPFTTRDTSMVLCVNLTSANTIYNMTNNIITSGYCFNITAENITLNCVGYKLTGSNANNTPAIYSNSSNSSVRNCLIKSFTTGIYLNTTANYATIANNTIYNAAGTIGSTGAANSTGGAGISVMGVYVASSNNIISNNTFANLTAGTGGNGGTCNSCSPGNACAGFGGIGGISTAVLFVSSSANTLTNNTVSNLTGGTGGTGADKCGTYAGGAYGGLGGQAGAFTLNSSSNNLITQCTASSITSGTGGVGGATYNGGVTKGGDGGAAYFAMLITSNQNNLTSISVANITSGTGGTVSQTDCGGCMGGLGGLSSAYILQSSLNNTINTSNASNIRAGNGGLGGKNGNNDYGGCGGNGGEVFGITLNASANTTVSTNRFINLTAGSGANGPGTANFAISCPDGRTASAGVAGPAGSGKNATGVYLLFTNSSAINGNTIFNLTAGIAGSGGTPTAVNGSTYGLLTSITSGSNLFKTNNITATIWVYDINDTNYYNSSTQGNIYYWTNNTAIWEARNGTNLNATSPPSWSETGYGVNASTFAVQWVGNGSDYWAWTNNGMGGGTVTLYTNITGVSVYWTGGGVAPSATSNLSCNVTAQNSNDTTMLVNITFYKNGVNQSTNITYNISNNTATLFGNATGLGAGENWSCSAIAWSSVNTSALNMSANVTVAMGGTADYVNITALSLTPVSSYANSTLQCSATAQSNNSSTINISYSWLRNGTNMTAYHVVYNVSNNTATIANLTLNSGITSKGDNWSCAVQAYDGINSSGLNYSSNITIANAPINNATISSITNATIGHHFNFTAYADDTDNGTDITNWRVNISYGTCVNVSNTAVFNRRTVNMTCNYTNPALATFNITFIDASGLENYTSNSFNIYPDPNNVSLTAPTITGTATVGNTLTCNAGTFTDGDADIENLTARTWQWYNGTATIVGQTASTFVIPAGWLGSQVKCQESVVAQNWTTSNAANNSTLTLITSTPPTNTSMNFTNATIGHWFYVNASAMDVDGGADITYWNITSNLGTCTNYSNSTSGNYRYATFNCTSANQGSASIRVSFNDSSNANVSINNTNTYPDPNNASLTAPTITPNPAYIADTLTCNVGSFSDADGDIGNTSSITYKWFKNGTLITGQTAATLAPTQFNKTFSIICEETETAENWTTSSAIKNSSALVISNTAPTTPSSDTLLPASPVITDTLTGGCSGSTDPDGDAITYYYRFYDITDAAYRGGGFTTTTTYALVAPTDSHDQFRVDCYASDGSDTSATRTGTTLRTIQNTLPTTPTNLLPNGGEYFNGTNININWTTSTDADGDTITYYTNWTNDSWATNSIAGNTVATNVNWDITGYPTLTTYKVVAIAGDGYGFSANVSSATTFTINHTVALVNAAPNITAIGVTPTTAYANTPLLCNVTARDNESISLTIFYGWFKNGANMSLSGSVNVSNGTNTNIVNLTSGYVKGDNISCYAIAYDGQNYSSLNFSTNVTILNSNPVNATIDSFTNATNTHSFLMNASAQDVDGGADITNWNISIDLGTCVNVSNSNSGVTKNIVMNCTSTANGTATIGITFKDAAGLMANSSTASSGYPYANATLTAPAISPSFPIMNDSFLNCTAGVFSTSPFADTENVSNRTWKWFRNGTELVGYTNQTLFNTTYNNTDVLICEETASNNTWGGYASANSSGVTVGTSLSISTAIIYPPTGSSYMGCIQPVIVQTNHTNPTDVGTVVTCRFYNWDGIANSSYTLNGTATSTGGNSTVNFTIHQSSPPDWKVNCTVTVAGVNATTQTVSFTRPATGPAFCNTDGSAASVGNNNQSSLYIIFIIIAICIGAFIVVNKNLGNKKDYKDYSNR